MSDSADEEDIDPVEAAEEGPLAADEFDPTSVEPDVPTVDDVATTPDLDEIDVDSETAGLFWRLVLVFDVALFALAIGPMLWYFEGKTQLGLQVFALGVVSFAYGVYRVHTRESGSGSESERESGSESERESGSKE